MLSPDIPQMTSKFVEIVPPSHQQGNYIPFAAIRWHDFGDRPALGRPFGHFFAIQTHPSCRFHLAVDFLGLRRSGFSTQLINPPQDFPKQVPRHSDFRHLERGVATTASSAGIANFRLWLQLAVRGASPTCPEWPQLRTSGRERPESCRFRPVYSQVRT